MQGRNRDRDIENGHVDSRGDGEVRTNWENSVDVSTLGFPGDRWRVGSCSIAHGVQLRYTETVFNTFQLLLAIIIF